MEILNM